MIELLTISINWTNLLAYIPIAIGILIVYACIMWGFPWIDTMGCGGEGDLKIWLKKVFNFHLLLVGFIAFRWVCFTIDTLNDPKNNGKIIEKVVER